MCCYDLNTNFLQRWLIILLGIWLSLSTARQAFDLIGKLWIPVVFNLFQVLACITGLFAAFQCRIVLLIILTISTVISIVYNITLFLWYEEFFGIELRDNSDILSAGVPFGHSFFLRYTPFCDGAAFFNLTSARWRQDHAKCIVPYYRLESVQASIHSVIAMCTLILSVLMLLRRKLILTEKYNRNLSPGMAYDLFPSKNSIPPSIRRKTQYGKNGSRRGRSNDNIIVPPNSFNNSIYSKTTALSNNFNFSSSKQPEKVIINGIKVTPPDSIDDLSSGYMNSSYDSGNCDSRTQLQYRRQKALLFRLQQQKKSAMQQSIPENLNSSEKHTSTFKKNNNEFSHHSTEGSSATFAQKNERLDDYSAATTIECDLKTTINQHSASNSTSSTSYWPQPPRLLPPQQSSFSTFAEQADLNINDLPGDQNNAIDNGDKDSSTTYSEINLEKETCESEYERPLRITKVFEEKTENRMQTPVNNVNNGRIYIARNAGGFSGVSSRYAKMRKSNLHSGNGTSSNRQSPINFSDNINDSQNSTSSNHYASHSQILNLQQQGTSHPNFPPNDQCSRSAMSTPNNLVDQNYSQDAETNFEIARNQARRNSATNLISFDPKSNTLIRVRKHHHEEKNLMPAGTFHQRSNSQPTHHYYDARNGNTSKPNISIIPNNVGIDYYNSATNSEFLTFGNIGNKFKEYNAMFDISGIVNLNRISFINEMNSTENSIDNNEKINLEKAPTGLHDEMLQNFQLQQNQRVDRQKINSDDSYNHVYNLNNQKRQQEEAQCIDSSINIGSVQPSTSFLVTANCLKKDMAQVMVASAVDLIEGNNNERNDFNNNVNYTQNSIRTSNSKFSDSNANEYNHYTTSFTSQNLGGPKSLYEKDGITSFVCHNNDNNAINSSLINNGAFPTTCMPNLINTDMEMRRNENAQLYSHQYNFHPWEKQFQEIL